MGARRVGLIVVAVYCVHAQTPVWTSDPAGDAKPGGPDIVAVQALVSNRVMTLRARYL